MFQHALLNEIIAFIAVAEHSSFTKAAESLYSTRSSTGKAVQKLEDELGVKLFNRSTRSVRLTEEGRIYLDAAKQAVDALNEAKLLLEARKAEPAGRLRVNLPFGIGRAVILALPTFLRRYPKISMEISTSDRFEDPIEGDWDIVIRIGDLEDSGIIARKLCVLQRVLYASPDYLERKGTPQKISDLLSHDAVLFRRPNGKVRPWKLKEGRQAITEISPTPLAIFNDGRAFMDAAISGLGIVQIYDKAVGLSLKNGELVEVLPDCAIGGSSVHALIPSGTAMPAKTRACLEFLVELFGNE